MNSSTFSGHLYIDLHAKVRQLKYCLDPQHLPPTPQQSVKLEIDFWVAANKKLHYLLAFWQTGLQKSLKQRKTSEEQTFFQFSWVF